jgi:hypothetical protein
MMQYHQVLLLHIAFKLNILDIERDVKRVSSRIYRTFYPGMHTDKTICYAVITEEDEQQLVDRMRPALESIGSILNYWCEIAPHRIAGRDGHMDPLVTALGEAWGKTRELNKSKYMGHPQRLDSRVAGGIENSERAAPVKMRVKTGGPRETLKNSNRK